MNQLNLSDFQNGKLILDKIVRLASPNSEGLFLSQESVRSEVKKSVEGLKTEEISKLILELHRWKERMKRGYFEEEERALQRIYRDKTRPVHFLKEEAKEALSKIEDSLAHRCALIDLIISALLEIKEKERRNPF